jgi:hypothetical protein
MAEKEPHNQATRPTQTPKAGARQVSSQTRVGQFSLWSLRAHAGGASCRSVRRWPFSAGRGGRRLRRRPCGAETPHHSTSYNSHPSIQRQSVIYPHHRSVPSRQSGPTSFAAARRPPGRAEPPRFRCEPGAARRESRTVRRLTPALAVVAVLVAKPRLPAAAAGGIAAASTQSFDFVLCALWAGSFCLHTIWPCLAYAKSVS